MREVELAEEVEFAKRLHIIKLQTFYMGCDVCSTSMVRPTLINHCKMVQNVPNQQVSTSANPTYTKK